MKKERKKKRTLISKITNENRWLQICIKLVETEKKKKKKKNRAITFADKSKLISVSRLENCTFYSVVEYDERFSSLKAIHAYTVRYLIQSSRQFVHSCDSSFRIW